MGNMSEKTYKIALCSLDELNDPGTRGIALEDIEDDIFVVRKGEQAYAYINRCPHTGSPLDWSPDQFLDEDDTHIMCATHMALFQIENGLCIAGPCVDQNLTALKVQIQNGMIYLLPRPS